MRRFARMAGCVCVLFTAWVSRGQDLVAVAPQAAKVEYEDARVRVVRLRLAAGASLPMHDRPVRVVVPLTANDVRTMRPDGGTSVVRSAAGNVAWSGPARRAVQNLGGALENIVVELKQAGAPAHPLEHPPSPRPATYLEEPFHHWLFENQYVRVYDVRIPPGKTTEFHLHALDTVIVQVSGGLVAQQTQGQEWGKPEKEKAGAVQFSADAGKPRTHRVRNEGTEEFHVVLVQLLR
jgi:quercetin dioxygenase-like cupin family protein